MSTLQVVLAALVGASLALGAFIGWVWHEWVYRPARIRAKQRG
jgi:hypothetical protein